MKRNKAKVTNDDPIEIINNEPIKNNPIVNTNTTDLAHISGNLFITGIDVNNPKIRYLQTENHTVDESELEELEPESPIEKELK